VDNVVVVEGGFLIDALLFMQLRSNAQLSRSFARGDISGLHLLSVAKHRKGGKVRTIASTRQNWL